MPPLCACGCLAYYYGLSGRLPGRWSLSELDTEISSQLWCVGHQGGHVELVWSSASHLTLVNSSNEIGVFLGGLFFISRVRGRRPRLAVCRSERADSWGRGLRKGVREGHIRAEGEGEKHAVASYAASSLCFVSCTPCWSWWLILFLRYPTAQSWFSPDIVTAPLYSFSFFQCLNLFHTMI